MQTLIPKQWHVKAQNFLNWTPRGFFRGGMGIGKTTLVYSSIQTYKILGRQKRPTLVLAPLAVCNGPWAFEIQKWDMFSEAVFFGLTVSIVTGTEIERLSALKVTADVYVMNYENIPWLLKQTGGALPFDRVICDESPRLKSARPSLNRSVNGNFFWKVSGGSSRAGELARAARYANFPKFWHNMTGTAVPNGALDLWGQTWFLDFGQRLGHSFSNYKLNYFVHIDTARKYVLKEGRFEEITAKLADITLSIDARDYYDIKFPIFTPLEVRLTEKLTEDFRKLKAKFKRDVAGINLTALSAQQRSLQCLQFCNGAIYENSEEDRIPQIEGEEVGGRRYNVVHDLKLERLANLVEELNGAPLIVAYWFNSDRKRLQKFFTNAVVMPEGMAAQQDVMQRWNRGEIQMLLANPARAGHGLSLQDGGHHLCFFSQWYNSEYHDQIIERIGPVRQFQSGYDRPVFVYYLIATTSTGGRTNDHNVYDVIVNKKEFSESFNEAMKDD